MKGADQTEISSREISQETTRVLVESFDNITSAVEIMMKMMNTIETATLLQEQSIATADSTVRRIADIGNQVQENAKQLFDVIQFFSYEVPHPSSEPRFQQCRNLSIFHHRKQS